MSDQDQKHRASAAALPDPSLAQAVAPALDSVEVHLVAFLAHRAPNTEISGTQVFNLSAEGAYWAKPDPKTLVVVFDFELTLGDRREGDEIIELGHHMLKYQVVYRLTKEHATWSDQQLESFVSHYGISHVWPYVRAEVQTNNAKLSLPAFRLPLLRFGQLPARFTIRQHSEADEVDEVDR